jgi:hypothetical protein
VFPTTTTETPGGSRRVPSLHTRMEAQARALVSLALVVLAHGTHGVRAEGSITSLVCRAATSSATFGCATLSEAGTVNWRQARRGWRRVPPADPLGVYQRHVQRGNCDQLRSGACDGKLGKPAEHHRERPFAREARERAGARPVGPRGYKLIAPWIHLIVTLRSYTAFSLARTSGGTIRFFTSCNLTVFQGELGGRLVASHR